MLEKETLSEALNYVQAACLPEPLKKNKIFVRALVKVRKMNNHEAICYAVNNGSGEPLVKKSFGSISMIKEVVEVYPLSYLEEGVLPDFRKKTDIVEYLKRKGIDEQQATELVMSDDKEKKKEAKRLVISFCIKAQIEQENMINKAPNIKSQSESINETQKEDNEETRTEDNSDKGEVTSESTGVEEQL